MRLFIGVRPPEVVLDEIAELVERVRPAADLRWATRDKWHVTLRFLGDVADPGPVAAALRGADLATGEASLGPAVRLLGGKVVCIPVEGLDELARAVTRATADIGHPPDSRRFRGHVTLARIGRKSRPPRSVRDAVVGTPIAASWPVEDVLLIRSHLSSTGAAYEDLAVFDLGHRRGTGDRSV